MKSTTRELYSKIGLLVLAVAIIQGIAIFSGTPGSRVDVGSIRANPDSNVVSLRCAPQLILGKVGEPVGLAATGGDGEYTWSAPGGIPSAGSGTVFSTRYTSNNPRTRKVTVSSGSGQEYQQTSCIVTF